jgi:ATP-dependent Lhr-like helicase
LVHRIGVWGKDVSFEERIERQAQQLLQCYGIVTRHSLEGWEGRLDWGALYAQFRLMEMRGQVRRGYFVQGLPGVQFALPEAVERLRDWTRIDPPSARDPIRTHDEGLVLINACDPANLFGPALNGVEASDPDPAHFMRVPSNYAVLLRGRPVLLLEIGGQRATSLPGLPQATLHRSLGLATEHLANQQQRLILRHWNGEPILDSSVAPVLERAGFRREALVYVWEG